MAMQTIDPAALTAARPKGPVPAGRYDAQVKSITPDKPSRNTPGNTYNEVVYELFSGDNSTYGGPEVDGLLVTSRFNNIYAQLLGALNVIQPGDKNPVTFDTDSLIGEPVVVDLSVSDKPFMEAYQNEVQAVLDPQLVANAPIPIHKRVQAQMDAANPVTLPIVPVAEGEEIPF